MLASSLSSESRQSSRKDNSQDDSATKTLPPSPPVSSPAASPFSGPRPLESNGSAEKLDLPQRSPADSYHSPSPSPPNSPISFGRLSSTHESPRPLANPQSPSFHSLVDRTFSKAADSSPAYTADSSNSSQMSVEQQLTQSLEKGYSSNSSSLQNSPSRVEPSSQSDTNIYAPENSLEASQQRTSPRKVAVLPYPSQPPSQFQRPLIHVHRPRGTQDSSQPLGTPIASLVPSTFAISTPPMQNWYQPSSEILQRRSSLNFYPPAPSQPASSSGKLARKSTTSREATPKRVRIMDTKNTSEPMNVDDDVYSQSQPSSDSYSDSFNEFHTQSYPPLQTQAPYDSQS
ncbi:hypothetical protein CVT24_008371 [Panaeolus cyanescens]|uniref:Uncharacterized protein n=1 Tax=Panaeolus cyanescens TaxID=181874 RepID=A0A409VC41_9AGAR|nr:hypothetical protein CVT24_008371 [Panaeolus cyanescens]